MDNQLGRVIITIGRESGSGGRKIALRLSEVLGIPCYDKELIAVAAKNSGLCEEILESHEERPTRSFLYSLVMDTYSMGYHAGQIDMPMEQKVFLAQYNTIKDLASKESCIFVGRCADYALEEDPDVVSVFITADDEDKIRHVMKTYELTHDSAKNHLQKTDKRRSNYYNYYSNKTWGEAQTYDLCLNRSRLGFEGTVEAIVEFVKLKKRHEKDKEAEAAKDAKF